MSRPARRLQPTRRNAKATQGRILGEASRLFSRRGFEATSLRQIAAAAEVDLATLKYHFRDKAALYAEVYQSGYDGFITLVQGVLDEMLGVQTKDDLHACISGCAHRVYDFLGENQAYIRLVLFRLLEDSTSPIEELEDELSKEAFDLMDGAIQQLVQRGVLRPVDTRALITLLVSGIPMWYVTAVEKPHWIGDPEPTTPAGRPRAEAFFADLLTRALVQGE